MSFSALQTVQLRAPQWSTDPRINSLITYAQQGLAAAVFGDRYGEAVGLKVLHLLAVEAINGGNPGTGTDSGDGTGGLLASESEGDLSRSYTYPGMSKSGSGTITASASDLSTTSYGKELLALMSGTIFRPMNRRM